MLQSRSFFFIRKKQKKSPDGGSRCSQSSSFCKGIFSEGSDSRTSKGKEVIIMEINKIGFLGIGTMGLPMAVNIVRAGFNLMIYNRTSGKSVPALESGATEVDSPEAVFKEADMVVLMLSGPSAIDAILKSVTRDSPDNLKGKVLVNMGTNPPEYSRSLSSRLSGLGAGLVDAPVSGTKVQAEQGALLIMASGPDDLIDKSKPLFEAVGNKVVRCGTIPNAGMMKLAVNIVLSAALSGLMEGTHFAQKADLDLATFFALILNGPLGNDMFAIKSKKIMEQDYSPQASIGTVHEMLKHIMDTAYETGSFIPNTASNMNLTRSAINKGLSDEDACAILKVFG
jgi:3-hydroxyisobutyrate dehydrogenase